METTPERWLNFDKEAFFSDIFDAVIEIACSNFFEMEVCATRELAIVSEESEAALTQGISAVFERFLSKFLDDDLAHWETYCREVCFHVPDSLVLPKKCEADPSVSEGEEEAKLDAELISLRARKTATEKEAAKLQRGIRSLEAHLLAKNTFVEAFELQSCSLLDDLAVAAREVNEKVEEADALRALRAQKTQSIDTSDPDLGAVSISLDY